MVSNPMIFAAKWVLSLLVIHGQGLYKECVYLSLSCRLPVPFSNTFNTNSCATIWNCDYIAQSFRVCYHSCSDPSLNKRIGRMSAAISTDVSVEHRSTYRPTYRSTYRSTYRPLLDQHPSTDMSVAMSTDISVERRSICRPTYRPICRSRCRPTYRSRGS